MNGFEALVVLLCTLACGYAAIRSRPVGRDLWLMTGGFFALMAAADFHDLLLGLSYPAGPVTSTLEFLGWCAYLPLALLIFFPLENDGRPDWTWLPVLDFLLVTEAAAVAYFRLVYIPHLQTGQPWTIVGHPEAVRNILLSGGLLLRSGMDPSSRARGFYRRIGGIFAVVMILRVVLPGYLNTLFALIRPAMWLLLGILAVRWQDARELSLAEDRRRGALRLLLSLSSAATMLMVVVLAWSAPSPFGGLMHASVAISVALFVLRGLHAEHSRYAAELRLRNSEKDYRVLFESAIVPIVISEPVSGRILQANAAACELYRVSPDDFIGASMKDFTREDALVEKQVAKLLREGTCVRFESVHRTKDGGELDVWVSSSVIRYGGRKAILSFNRDMTERKKGEERFAKAFGAIPVPVTISSLSDGRYLDVNEAFLRATGHARDEVIGRTASDIGFWPTAEMRSRFLDELKGGSVRDFEVRFCTKSGQARLGLVSGETIELAGESCVLAITLDVTERKQAEEALRESEDRYRDLVEQSNDLICTHDLKGNLLSVNQAPARILGYAPEDLLGMPMKELVSPEFRPFFDEYLQRVGRDGYAQGLLAVRTRGGEKRIWEYRSTLRIEGVAEPVVRGMAHDVTERKRAEKALRESEEKFRKAFMTGADAFYIASLNEGRLIEANERFEDVFGYPREESIGKTAFELGLYADPADRGIMVREVKSKGFVRNLELKGMRRGKEPITVLLSANLLEGGGEPVILGVVRDITQQKRVQDSLVTLKQAVDASGEVVFMTDPEGLITSINPEFTRLYGYTAEEVVGKTTPRILKGGQKSPDDYARFWNAILNKRIARGTVANRTKEGRLVSVESSVNPILDESGEITGFLAIQRDVTARKQLEEQFRQAQKMEAIGRLAGGVAHDFNNLLTIINGYGQLLEERFGDDERVRAHVGEILKAGNRATALTRQLLAFSRRQVLEPKDLDLAAVVEGMQTMLRRIIGEDVELKISLHRPLGLIKADPTQIEQAIMNLAVNARDAMPHGGKLTIETAPMELDENYAASHQEVMPGRYSMLAVSDSGIGMDAQTLAHIFEPFFTTKERGKGTGLGLSTVYGIVKQTRGHILVYSEPGHGTTFKVLFPLVATSPQAPGPAEVISVPLRGTETILIIEDEDAVRRFAASILQGYGYKVLECGRPQDAIRIGEDRQKHIDLLLTDVVMPGLSGRNVAEHLAFLRPELKVLYMSGYTDDAILHHGVFQAEVAFIQKPFTAEDLARKIREVLDASQGPAQQAA